MRLHRAAGVLALALAVTACADSLPTESGLAPGGADERRGGVPAGGPVERGELLAGIPVVDEAAGFEGTLTVTQIELDEATSQLTVDGILTWTDGGNRYAEVVEDVPATLSRTATGGASMALLPSGGALQQRGPAESGVCDVLYLDLGPLFLDVLGLTVDLAPVELDVDAVPGGGRLLGNLLCAVTGLLDGAGSLGSILNLLDRINDLLDIGNLLGNLPVTGALEDGGTFSGVLDILAFDFDELTSTLTVTGLLNGAATQGGTVTEIVNQVFTTTLDLSSVAGALGANAALIPSGGALQQRGPAESGVCDVLYLDLGPLFLDVLGLTVDLAPVELDVDAVPGGGRLLGNLLCAVTGLLDPLGGLLQILAILEQINDILDFFA